jgi:hypothetical protein
MKRDQYTVKYLPRETWDKANELLAQGHKKTEVVQILGIKERTFYNLWRLENILNKELIFMDELKSEVKNDAPCISEENTRTNLETINKSKQDRVRRFIFTSAQNNTEVNEPFWNNLLAFAHHIDAKVLVGTFSYNKSTYGKKAVKRNTLQESDFESTLWYDDRIVPYICDKDVHLCGDWYWRGSMNIPPTSKNVLNQLESINYGTSNILPNSKLLMKTRPRVRHSDSINYNYTTGAVTIPNYIQKLSGQLSEYNHKIGALLLEIDGDEAFAFHLEADEDDFSIYFFNTTIKNGSVIHGDNILAINWGDIHTAEMPPAIKSLVWKSGGIIDILRPKKQYFNDLYSMRNFNHHDKNDYESRLKKSHEGSNSILQELEETVDFLKYSYRSNIKSINVPSNHDRHLDKFIDTYDPKESVYPNIMNDLLYHELSSLRIKKKYLAKEPNFNLLKSAFELIDQDLYSTYPNIEFPSIEENGTITKKNIENLLHGDYGVAGTRGSSKSYANIGLKSTKGHDHMPSRIDDVMSAGAMSLDFSYVRGILVMGIGFIVTFENGSRTNVIINPKTLRWSILY